MVFTIKYRAFLCFPGNFPIIQFYDLSICEPDHDLDVFEMLAASLVFGCLTAVSRISKGF